MNNNVYWILEVAIKQGKLKKFEELMNEMVETTESNEPDTLNYEFSISEDNKTCHTYERYADSAATMTHLASFGQNFSDRFMEVVEIKRFVVYGNPNDEVQNALTGFGAIFMSPVRGFARRE